MKKPAGLGLPSLPKPPTSLPMPVPQAKPPVALFNNNDDEEEDGGFTTNKKSFKPLAMPVPTPATLPPPPMPQAPPKPPVEIPKQ